MLEVVLTGVQARFEALPDRYLYGFGFLCVIALLADIARHLKHISEDLFDINVRHSPPDLEG